ncbi:MAG: hypothetical protein HRT87_08030 [Legionellales bacterium]|nr:hypothetical protein [Legionellales bacterium]
MKKKLNDEQLANKYYLMADGYMSSSRVNRAKAINYYRRASELGHTLAMESLGDLLIEQAKKMVKKFNNNKLSVNEKGCIYQIHAEYLIKSGADDIFCEAFYWLSYAYEQGGKLAKFYFSNGRYKNWRKIIELINCMKIKEAA